MPVGRSPPRAKNADDFKKLMSEKFASPPDQQQQLHNKRPRSADSPQLVSDSQHDTSSMNMESKISEILLTVRQIKSDFSALSVKVNDIEQAVDYNSAEITQLRAENEKLKDENSQIKTRKSKKILKKSAIQSSAKRSCGTRMRTIREKSTWSSQECLKPKEKRGKCLQSTLKKS